MVDVGALSPSGTLFDDIVCASGKMLDKEGGGTTGSGDLTSVSVIVSTARMVVTTWKRDVEEDVVTDDGEAGTGRTAAGIVVGVYLYVKTESDKVASQNEAARLTKNPCIPKHDTNGKASAMKGELSRHEARVLLTIQQQNIQHLISL